MLFHLLKQRKRHNNSTQVDDEPVRTCATCKYRSYWSSGVPQLVARCTRCLNRGRYHYTESSSL